MGKFSCAWLLGKKQFRSLAGVSPPVFQQMVKRLRSSWDHRMSVRNRSGRPFGVGGLEDHLLVLLILYRCAVTQDFLACLYGVDKATICRSLARIERLAKRALGVSKRLRVTAREAEALIMDCTEQPIQRPKRRQRRWYSGKKKRHTVKNEIIVTEAGRIAAASDDAPGRTHDVEIRRRGPPLPEDARGYADSGYQGYQHDHAAMEIPYKRTKKSRLTKDEKPTTTTSRASASAPSMRSPA